jgi:hypothetical protein
MATDRSMYASMITAHNDGPRILCDDGNGAIPEMVNRLAVQSKPGRLMLLPAIPDVLSRGTLSGTRARGQVGVRRISWDMKAGTLTAVLTSEIKQTLDVVLPPGMVVEQLTANGKPLPVIEQGVRKRGCKLDLPKRDAVTLEARFRPRQN